MLGRTAAVLNAFYQYDRMRFCRHTCDAWSRECDPWGRCSASPSRGSPRASSSAWSAEPCNPAQTWKTTALLKKNGINSPRTFSRWRHARDRQTERELKQARRCCTWTCKFPSNNHYCACTFMGLRSVVAFVRWTGSNIYHAHHGSSNRKCWPHEGIYSNEYKPWNDAAPYVIVWHPGPRLHFEPSNQADCDNNTLQKHN